MAYITFEDLNADFTATNGTPFQHFYCPILHVDEASPLCDGHVVNDALPNCARAIVIQREDVDNFYGRIEAEFVTLVSSKPLTMGDILFDPDLRKKIWPKLTVDGEILAHYPYLGTECPADHTMCRFERDGGDPFSFVIKKSRQEMRDSLDKNWEIVVDRCYIAPVVASLIKAGYLTLFRMLGYQYVASTADRFVASILGQFFRKFSKYPNRELRENLDRYFEPYCRMVWPLQVVPTTSMTGTVSDRKTFCCWGGSNRPFAMGVYVRTDNMLHAVVVPTGGAEELATYLGFMNDPPETFGARFTRFHSETSPIGSWEMDAESRRFPTPHHLRDGSLPRLA